MNQPPSLTLDHLAKRRQQALDSGSLVPMDAESHPLEERGLPYQARWISTLSLKIMAKALQDGGEQQENPFLPYDPNLFVAHLPPAHVLIFNKFGISENHLLVITRGFESQEAPVTPADFAAIAPLLGDLGGVLMFNGGTAAGASQPHKHFHLMPGRELPLAGYFNHLVSGGRLIRVPEFGFRHGLTALGLTPEMSAEDKAGMLQDACRACLAMCELTPDSNGLMPPYNILASREWLLAVPRSATAWVDGDARVHVHAMTFGGEVGVASEHQIDIVKNTGLLKILAATTVPG